MERPAERVGRGREVGLAAWMEGGGWGEKAGFCWGRGVLGAALSCSRLRPRPVGMCPALGQHLHSQRPSTLPSLQWLKEEDEEGEDGLGPFGRLTPARRMAHAA